MLSRQSSALARALVVSIAWWAAAVACAAPLIERAYTTDARYDPDAVAVIHVALENTTGAAWEGPLRLAIWNGASLAHIARQDVALAAGATADVQFAWTTPPVDSRGYLVVVTAGTIDSATTAIDVSTDWTRFPRYGYLTEFYAGQSPAASAEMIRQLVEDYHINGIQFYDWMWRHENVIKWARPNVIADPWLDWRGELISFSVLQDLIAAGHARRVAAMPYFMIYGGQVNYETISGVSPEWAIYADPAHATQHTHEGWLYLFDAGHPDWQQHLLGEVDAAITTLAFDGIHYDQLGERNPIYDYWGNLLDWSDGAAFRQMLDLTLAELDSLAAQLPPTLGQYALTFNLVDGRVDGWASAQTIPAAPYDFLYSEIWSLDSYAEIRDFVHWARDAAGGKALVLAAYMNLYESFSTFDEPSVRLADAAFATAGAHHIELGDGSYMLGAPFFPDRSKTPTPGLLAAMREYYDFLTAHERLLFDPAITHHDPAPQWLSVQGAAWSTTPEANRLWVAPRRLDECDALFFVNLTANDDQWRNAANAPAILTNITITYRLGAGVTITDVVYTSPDVDGGLPQSLPFTQGTDSTGPYVRLDIPSIEYWAGIILRHEFALPPGGRYEAEDAIKTNVAVDDDHPGYSGTGFVDDFLGTAEGVSFYVQVPADGWYDLALRYANATGSAATRRIQIDGADVGDVLLPTLPDWDTWGTATLPVYLSAGTRQLDVGFGGVGAINLDYIELPADTQGLLAEYCDAPYFAHRQAVTIDATVDFAWPASPPLPSMDAADYIVRWSGRVIPPATGAYTFITRSAGPVRLFVDGRLVVDNWTDHAPLDDAGQVDLTAGTPATVVLVYREPADTGEIRLSWVVPGGSRTIIPASALQPAAGPADRHAPTAPAALTADDIDPEAVTLSWAASTDDIALGGYEVRIDGVVADRTSATQLTLTGLTPEVPYTFTVAAFDIFGNVSAASAPLIITPPAVLFGDGDLDGDVDSADALLLMDSCWTGPAPVGTPPPAGCLDVYDSDADGDVDLHDHAAFMLIYPHD